MSKKQRTIQHDPRYAEFVVKYWDNLPQYVMDHSRNQSTWQQMDMMKSITKPGCRVAVASGHGSGKSALLGWVLDWHLRVFPFSNGLLTANNIEQTRIGVWKYLDEVQADMDYCRPWMTQHVVKEAKKYYINGYKDSWYFMPKTAGKANPQGLAGQHAKHYMAVVDEASEVEDIKHDVIEGALTQARNRHVLVSQPTRIAGRFADCFKPPLNAIYETFNLNSEESPLVDKIWIAQQLAKYGGHHSPEYQIRVLGRFPDNLAGFLIPRQWWDEAVYTLVNHTQPWGWVVLVDVAEGMFRDSSVWTVAKVSGYGTERKVEVVEIYESLDRNELAFARELYQRIQTLPNVTVAVDSDGCGRTVALTLEELGVQVEHIHWGLPPHADADKKRYKNMRAYSAVKVREALFENRIRIPRNPKLMDQGAKIPYRLDEAGRYAIMPKEQMRTQGIKSPDLFDTVCFAYLVDYVPVSDEASSVEKDAILQAALELLKG